MAGEEYPAIFLRFYSVFQPRRGIYYAHGQGNDRFDRKEGT